MSKIVPPVVFYSKNATSPTTDDVVCTWNGCTELINDDLRNWHRIHSLSTGIKKLGECL